tara:strand:+ start:47 stop:2080 length:2034 start_codon:yes stop_codon:yes gene_type:complete
MKQKDIEEIINLIKSQNLDEAEIFAKTFYEKDPKDPIAINLFGSVLLQKTNFLEARELFLLSTKIDNTNQSSFYNLGISLINIQEYDEALDVFLQAIDIKESATIYTEIGNIYTKKSEDQLAIEYYKKALKIDNKFSKALNNLANIYEDTGNYKKAVKYYKEAIRSQPENSLYHYNLAVSLFNNKEEELSINYFKKAIELNSRLTPAYIYAGQALQKQNNYQESLIILKQAELNGQNNAQLYFYIAMSEIQLGQYNEGLSSLEKAIDLKPDYVEAYNNLGILWTKKGQYELAIEQFETAIAFDNEHISSFNNLGNTLLKTKKNQLALETFKESYALNEKNIDTILGLALAYKNNENFDEAIALYKKASNSGINKSKANTELADLYFQINEYENALKFYKTVDEEERSQQINAKIAECFFNIQDIESFSQHVKNTVKKDKVNTRLSAICAYASEQLNIKNDYPFCKNPLDLIEYMNCEDELIENNIALDQFNLEIKALSDEKKTSLIWEPSGKTTRGGYSTIEANIFDFSHEKKCIGFLKDLILKKTKVFLKKNKHLNETLFSAFPLKNYINGWYVNFKKGGYQDSHIHPHSFLSGVFYIDVPIDINKPEGGIEFSLHGYDYKKIKEAISTKIINPRNGDLVLFPSSLFHRTIPFSSINDRNVIAFDLMDSKDDRKNN